VTRQDNVVAQALLEKATAIDPNYGQALGVLAASQTFSAHMGWADMAAVVPIAERAALAAIRADSEDPWAHYALGNVCLFTRRFDDSLAEFELALRLNPNFSLAQGYYGLALSYCGRCEEADLAARRALRLSPRDPFSAIYCGIAAYSQFVGHHYDEAMRLAREAIRQRIDFVGGHRVLTAAAGMAGQEDAAKAALLELRRAQPNISLDWVANQMPFNAPPRNRKILASPKPMSNQPKACPVIDAMRVARTRLPVHPQMAARKTRPPSSGKAGTRLKIASTRLMNQRYVRDA
jgi:tetratricopeptide (TPR) repeat protein